MQQGLRIGIAQINGTVGDFPGNAKKILAAYRECLDQGADLVLTPELSLVGYPPRDLVQKSQFVPKCLQALDYLSEEIKTVPLIVGYVDHNTDAAPGRPFRNAAAWLEKGRIVHKVWKTLLPTYDVFDELRYFELGERCEAIVWNGHRIGITICEDIWNEEFLPRPLYDRDPVAELAAQNIEFVPNNPELNHNAVSVEAQSIGDFVVVRKKKKEGKNSVKADKVITEVLCLIRFQDPTGCAKLEQYMQGAKRSEMRVSYTPQPQQDELPGTRVDVTGESK